VKKVNTTRFFFAGLLNFFLYDICRLIGYFENVSQTTPESCMLGSIPIVDVEVYGPFFANSDNNPKNQF
jgi:hypothetical protein